MLHGDSPHPWTRASLHGKCRCLPCIREITSVLGRRPSHKLPLHVRVTLLNFSWLPRQRPGTKAWLRPVTLYLLLVTSQGQHGVAEVELGCRTLISYCTYELSSLVNSSPLHCPNMQLFVQHLSYFIQSSVNSLSVWISQYEPHSFYLPLHIYMNIFRL